ncbi:MAG: fructose-1,6-bisphosphate aldolase/phosphatase [Candidatus Aenigmatarchaeota archaeon]
MAEKITLSLIKADIGSVCGHHVVHPKQIELAKKLLESSKKKGKIIDYYVFNCGDDLELLFTHREGENNPKIHEMAWNVFKEVTEKVSKKLKLYAAGQDLLVETFSGNVKGMGPGVAEMEIEERPSESIVVFAADKTEPGAWNLPLYKIFADPSNTAGLILSEDMSYGFTFRVLDVIEGKYIDLNCPEDIYNLISLIGTTGRFVVERVFRRKDKMLAAVASTTRLRIIAHRYTGKDDPVLMIRLQHQFPALGEVLSAFVPAYLVSGAMRGSHRLPLLPVSLKDAKCSYWDGPPRCVALGFNLCEGKIVGKGDEPADLFDDPAFDYARLKAMEISQYIRQHGEFEPARLPEEDLEYLGISKIREKLKERWVKLKEQ